MLIGLLALASGLIAWDPFSPYLLLIRPYLSPITLGMALVAALAAVCLMRQARNRRLWPVLRMAANLKCWLVLAVFAGCASAASWQIWGFSKTKQEVLQQSLASPNLHTLGRHFIISYRDFDEAALLAKRGAIAGIYLRSANVHDKSAFQIRSEVMALQRLRQRHGLPPLIITADQEGGAVQHMSPPLPRRLPLADLLTNFPATLEDEVSADSGAHKIAGEALLAVYDYGVAQGQELATLGINLNLGPIADLSPNTNGRIALDTHTQLSKRALSAHPYVVAQATSAYIQGLQRSGVQATLKHFPGLSRIDTDTHHFAATLATPSAMLAQSDWQPFRHSMPQAAATMLGHVTVQDVDASVPASLSAKVVAMLRDDWGYQGLLITDDINMGALYHRYGICESTLRALNAGIDLVLISYDPDQYYPAMACALRAMAGGQLQLSHSPQTHARIARWLTPAAATTAVPSWPKLPAHL